MKANEFFKAMGINAVRQFLENDNIRTKEMSDELKRLVESHELVEKFGGLDKAKKSLEKAYKRFTTKISYSVEIDDKTYLTGVFIEDLEQAIADVESCMEVMK